MLWIAMVLPQLPLQVSHRGLLPDLPLAVSDGALQRPVVIAANEPAGAAGIVPGLPVAAAQALVRELVVQPHDPARSQAAIDALGHCAAQFTPSVCLEADGVLLEVAASLTLFGGLAALGRKLERAAKRVGFDVSVGAAPTPLAALLFARARIRDRNVRSCLSLAHLPARLGPLPIDLFGWPADLLDTMARLGVSTIGACRALPREGVIRRFGASVPHDLDRADGSVPDPREWFVPPLRFASRIELPCDVEQVDQLIHPIERLLAELEGYLQARQHGTHQLLLTLEQGRQGRLMLEIAATRPCRFAEDFLVLVQERLARTVLSAPVRSIAVRVERLVPCVPENRTLPVGGDRHVLAWSALCDRLVARLPPGQLHRLAIGDDHRPEKAWRWKTDIRESGGRHENSTEREAQAVPTPPRPAWLLPVPRLLRTRGTLPCHDGPLTLLTEPERIESGWWDDCPVSRDYYIARNPAGQLCWVFHDHADRQWYLHGLFG